MSRRYDILTLFPEVFTEYLGRSIPGRARAQGLVEYPLTNIRDFSTDVHKSVDDRPFGGGPGMVMMCQTVFDAVEHAEKQDPRPARRILMTPCGRVFDQAMACELALEDRLLFVCGHYEGLDQRIVDGLAPLELSIGDYVLSGGELAALVVIDALVRLLPGALGHNLSNQEESFSDHLLEYPQYTRPREFRGMKVPDILLTGDHARIAAWREEQRQEITRRRRPDLWRRHLNPERVRDNVPPLNP